MKRLADFRKQVIEGWTVQRIAAVLIVIGVIVFVAGVVNKHCACAGWPNLGEALNDVISDFYANVSVDCLSVAFAILVIDRLNEQREIAEKKAQLIREMGSKDNGIAVRAVRELRAQGWLQDGSLRKIDLLNANLRGAELRQADLQEADLRANLQEADLRDANLYNAALEFANLEMATLLGANLEKADLIGAKLHKAILSGTNLQDVDWYDADVEGAYLFQANLRGARDLTNQQLCSAIALRGALMPDGSRYDGRYNLEIDIRQAASAIEQIGFIDPEDPVGMAFWYDITLEEYLAGQAWAHEHLADLRRSTGLDPDTGLPVEPTSGIEPQPADAPAQPAPRRNGHKASMVSHRVRYDDGR